MHAESKPVSSRSVNLFQNERSCSVEYNFVLGYSLTNKVDAHPAEGVIIKHLMLFSN